MPLSPKSKVENWLVKSIPNTPSPVPLKPVHLSDSNTRKAHNSSSKANEENRGKFPDINHYQYKPVDIHQNVRIFFTHKAASIFV
jgi:hypothetical protein